MINHNNSLLKTTSYISLISQIVTGIVGLHGIMIALPKEHQILSDIMVMETIVQFIEFAFYIWLVTKLSTLTKEVTYVRYFDWMLSTPMMLLSMILYFQYNNGQEIGIEYSTWNILGEFGNVIGLILVANWVMLLGGYLAERKYTSRIFGFVLGMAAFLYSFWMIYKNFVESGTNWINHVLYNIMFGIWLLYGVAFLFPYFVKNAMYNILDIFAKNFYGLYVYWLILKVRG
jgi:bacteriorhodopsin